MPTYDELLAEIFDGRNSALYFELEQWLRDSRRFKQFAATYRAKIRAKVKRARDDASVNDLRAELETAALLLCAESFTLEYEKYAALKQRGPDYTVTFKTHTPFNVEVRRIRNLELETPETETRIGKLMAVLCDKVEQMPPSIVNLLWLIGEREISLNDIASAIRTLRELAELYPQEVNPPRGIQNAADFLKQSHRLSGIVLRHANALTIWQNPLARHRIPTEIVNTLQRLTR